jgi:hypothetical protein
MGRPSLARMPKIAPLQPRSRSDASAMRLSCGRATSGQRTLHRTRPNRLTCILEAYAVTQHDILSETEIIAQAHSGALVTDLSNWEHDGNQPDSLLNKCVALHNNAKIDLLHLLETPQFNALERSDFFAFQYAFCLAIPRIEASPERMMQAVKLLVEKGTGDLAQNHPNGSLLQWCTADPTRATRIVELAEQDHALAIHSLTFALQALADVDLSRSIAKKYSDERRLSAISALGRIKPPSDLEAEQSATLLISYMGPGSGEDTRGNALLAFFAICENVPPLAEILLAKAIAAATMDATVMTLMALSQAVFAHTNVFDRESLEISLNALTSLPASDPRVPHLLDNALTAVIKSPNSDLATTFVTTLLRSPNSALSLKELKQVRNRLASSDRNRLYQLVSRWLLSGDNRLGDAASSLIDANHEDVPFDAHAKGLELTNREQLHLCHKAIGYLFHKPVTTCSILVSVLRDVDSAVTDQVIGLLFDPLLINYGGAAKKYLTDIPASDPAKELVGKALDRERDYIAGLNATGRIAELHPSEYQRSLVRRHIHDSIAAAHKKAEKKSVLLTLARRSTLLYGKRSITYVTDPSGETRAVRMDLKQISTSVELPRMQILDPVGLDYMLRIFRFGKLKQ